MTYLTLDEARAIADRAFAHAAERGLNVTVALVDPRGHTILVLRSDAARWFTADVARNKARTAAAMGQPTHALADLAQSRPEVFAQISDQLPFRPLTIRGGTPIHRDGELIGAIGISGATSDEDLVCALDALGAITHDEPVV